MADAREEHVWSEHALRDHTNLTPYVGCTYIDDLLKLTKGVKLVMDLGCGSGLWRPVFNKFKYIGLDQNKDMINVAKQHYPEAYVCHDPNATWLNDWLGDTAFAQYNGRQILTNIFDKGHIPDLVWCSAVLQHNRESDKDEIIKNVYNLLTPGKYWMFTECTFDLAENNYKHVNNVYSEDMTDGWSYTSKGWERFMNDRGFKLVGMARFNYYLWERV